MQVRRREYLEQEHAWKDVQVIKVVTGMRRAGNRPCWRNTVNNCVNRESRRSGSSRSTLKNRWMSHCSIGCWSD